MRIDPMTEDESWLATRAEEEEREQRWIAFSAEVKTWHYGACGDWVPVLAEITNGYRHPNHYGPGRLAWHMQQFAESDGWPAVLSAVARLMKEMEADASEVERRR